MNHLWRYCIQEKKRKGEVDSSSQKLLLEFWSPSLMAKKVLPQSLDLLQIRESPKKRYVLQLTDVHVKIITAGASIHRWDKFHSTTLSNALLFGCSYVLEELLLLTLKVHISETKANEKNISKEVDAP